MFSYVTSCVCDGGLSKFLCEIVLIKRKYLVLSKFSDEPGDEEPVVVAAPVSTGSKKKLINQFNFCERAALTYNNPSRVSKYIYFL